MQILIEGKICCTDWGPRNDVVAYGTVITLHEKSKTLHGRPMPKDCMRVSIDEVVDANALLPFSIPNVCDNVGDAIGTHVAWPNSLVVLQKKVFFLTYFYIMKFDLVFAPLT